MIEFFDELFRERELILRSQGRVHFLPLTRRLQMSAFMIAVAIGVWGIGMTLMSTVKSGIIHVKNDEIREARVAYEDLFEEVLRYQKKVATVTSNLRDSQESLLEQVGNVVKLDNKKVAKLRQPLSGQAKTADGDLREHLNDIDKKVQVMTETNSLLEGSLLKIKTELKLAGDERNNIIKTRTKLRERVAELEEFLIKSRTESAYLERRVTELADSLSESRSDHDKVVEQREKLNGQVATLEHGIKDAKARAEHAELDLNKVLDKLEKTTGADGNTQVAMVTDGGDELAGLPGSVSEIDNRLTRWAGLRKLLQSIPLISPVDYYHQASDFGLRRDPFTKKRAMHYGVDLAGWRGAGIYSTAPGRVVFAGRKGRYGKMVEIDHGYGVRTRYGHLLKVLVKRGQEVGHRHKVALLGSTGRSTGPHVHYEVRFDGKPLNPARFIKAGRYVFKEQ